MTESQNLKQIIKTSVVKFLEHLQGQKDSLEKELSYLLEELRLNSVISARPDYSISEVNQLVKTINATMSDYFKKTFTSISVSASRRMRLVLDDLLRLVGGALGEADIDEIIQKIEAFESQMLMAEEMAEKLTTLENLMKERETEIAKINELRENERLKKEELEQESLEKTKRSNNLENEIARLEGELKFYVNQIESGDMISTTKIEELKTTVEERERRIEELEGRLKELDSSEKDEIETLRTLIREKELTLQEKEKELESLQMQMQEKDIVTKPKPRPKPKISFQFEWFPCVLTPKKVEVDD